MATWSADVYALGLSLLELHRGTRERQNRHKMESPRGRWLAQVGDALVGDGIESLLDRMTDPDPMFAFPMRERPWRPGKGIRAAGTRGKAWLWAASSRR